MLHLTFAPRANGLLPLLISTVKTIWKDPLRSPVFVVPNHAVGKWLELTIADRLGCCINIRLETVESFLLKELQIGEGLQLLDKRKLQQVLMSLLNDATLAEDVNSQLRGYLGDAETINPVKKVQLASEIARLFLEYEYNRPSVWSNGSGTATGRWMVSGVDQNWISGNARYFSNLVSDKKRSIVASHEAWQQNLYHALFRERGLLGAVYRRTMEPGKTAYCTLPQLYALNKGGDDRAVTGAENDPMVLFLISKVSHFHRNALIDLSTHRDLHLFLVNPCAEFWEDVDTTRFKKGRRSWIKRGPDKKGPIPEMSSEDFNAEALNLGVPPSENRLLELWGAGGKENIALWCQAAQYNFEYLTVDNNTPDDNPSLLLKIQRAIVTRDVLPPSGNDAQDSSICFYSAPDMSREMENVREVLLNTLHEHPEYRVDDIIVYLPDIKKYLPHIHLVFGGYQKGDPGFLPYKVPFIVPYKTSSAEFPEIGGYAKAVEDFLSLCDNHFTRAGVFAFLRNDPVTEATGCSREELTLWERWAEETGFFRGYDTAHRLSTGAPLECASDEHTFVLSEARLLAGGLAVLPISLGHSTTMSEALGVLPYVDFDTSDDYHRERYCATIERLASSCLLFKNRFNEKTIVENVRLFREMVDEWIKARDTRGSAREQFIESLAGIELQESIGGRSRMTFDEFKATVLSLLPDDLPVDNGIFSGYCTFAPLKPGYVLPGKVIVAAGMDAESFPGIVNDTPFNLLSTRRIVGDSDIIRDNRYLFLELVCAAGDKLLLSWQGRDIENDSTLEPSSVVTELASFAGIGVPGISSKSDNGTRGVLPITALDSIDNEQEIPYWDLCTVRASIIKQNSSSLGTRDFSVGREVLRWNGNDTKSFGNKKISLTTADISLFLKNPLEYHLLKTMKLRNEEPDMTMLIGDEPIESTSANLSRFKKRLLTDIVHELFPEDASNGIPIDQTVTKISEMVDKLYIMAKSAGKTPEAGFEMFERAQLTRWGISTGNSIFGLREKIGAFNVFDFRNGGDRAKSLVPFIDISVKPDLLVHIVSEHPLVLVPHKSPQSPVLLKTGHVSSATEKTASIDLWLTAMMLSMNGCDGCMTGIISSTTGEMALTSWQNPQPWSCETGTEWLKAIVTQMVVSDSSEHIPAVWITAVLDRNERFDEQSIKRLRILADEDSGSTAYQPLYRPFSDAVSLLQARLPADDEKIYNAYQRLLPVIAGRFYEQR